MNFMETLKPINFHPNCAEFLALSASGSAEIKVKIE